MPDSPDISEQNSLTRLIIAEPTVLTFIGLNALAVFLSSFDELPKSVTSFFRWIDYICVCYFVIEAVSKIRQRGFKGYWAILWNRFDLFIVLASMPLLMQGPEADLGLSAIAPLLRVGRFLRFLRLVRFVPDAPRLWRGTMRAIRASVGVFIVLLVLNLILAMGANILFGKKSPEHFGDPLIASYTLFKVFTVEGWHEIPDEIVDKHENPQQLSESDDERIQRILEALDRVDGGQSIAADAPTAAGGRESADDSTENKRPAEPMTNAEKLALRGYFIFSVLIGGILGLSLANAIFVDEMMMDNNQELEARVTSLQEQIADLKTELLDAIKK